MRESRTEPGSTAIPKRGIELPHGATDCTTFHASIARTIWPNKTAHHWGAAAGAKERMAKYWLAGRHVSKAAKFAIIAEITKRE